MISKREQKDLLKTVRITWGILSILAIIPIAASLMDKGMSLYRFIPICPSKTIGIKCILCGSTTAYYEIGRGNYASAWSLNPLGTSIYFLSVLNIGLFLFYQSKNFHRGSEEGISS